MFTFHHFNFHVLDLERSLKFYDEALGLKPVREKLAKDGSFRLVYLGDGVTDFQLELTYLVDRTEPYDLGECEFHLATPSMRSWAASALRTPPWASILLKIPTAIGSRSFPRVIAEK